MPGITPVKLARVSEQTAPEHRDRSETSGDEASAANFGAPGMKTATWPSLDASARNPIATFLANSYFAHRNGECFISGTSLVYDSIDSDKRVSRIGDLHLAVVYLNNGASSNDRKVLMY